MNGDFTSRALMAPNWIQPFRGKPPVADALPRRGSFLHRDLSEEALRTPAEPVFSQDDLARARQEGYAAGHAAASTEAAASLSTHQVETELRALGVIAAAMQQGCHLAAAAADVAAASLAKTVIAAMAAVMPALIRRSAIGETAAMLAHVLPGLSREPTVRIEVPPDLAAYVEASCKPLASQCRGTIIVTGESAMRPGDARVHWSAGHARRQPAEVWQSVMEALDPVLDEPQEKDTVHVE